MLLETKLCIFGLCTIFSMVMPEVIAMKEREGISFPSALLRQFIDFRKSGEDEDERKFIIINIWPIVNILFLYIIINFIVQRYLSTKERTLNLD